MGVQATSDFEVAVPVAESPAAHAFQACSLKTNIIYSK